MEYCWKAGEKEDGSNLWGSISTGTSIHTLYGDNFPDCSEDRQWSEGKNVDNIINL